MRRIFLSGLLVCGGMVMAAACGDDETGGSGGTTTSSSSATSSSGTSSTSSGTGGAGQGGMGQGGMGQGGAGGADCSDGGPEFGNPCDPNNSICGCGVCFGFMMGNNNLCTIPCMNDTDCPPPATQCNNQNVCGFN